MFCFIRKIHEIKKGHPHSYLYNKHCEHKEKISFNFENVYVSKTRKETTYEPNKQGPKMIWVPKVKN